MSDEELWLYTLCKKNGILITDIQLRQLVLYKQEMLEWNKKINLISRQNEDRLWKGHITLSITMLFKLVFQPKTAILDLGTGGGLPGIPLSIMLPDCSFVLLDSTKKKITAVYSMIDTLGLKNVSAVWGRAEEVQKQKPFARSFDAVVARSVSNVTNLLDWGLPFLKPKRGINGESEKYMINTPSLITFKGSEITEEEQSAQKKYPSVSLRSLPLIFPGSEEFEMLDKKLLIAFPH